MSTFTTVYFSLGSNIAPRKFFLETATDILNDKIGYIIKTSNVYETEAWGVVALPFLNSVIEIETELSVFEILKKIQNIEKSLGRVQKGKPYSARKIDIDILYFGSKQIHSDELTVPHRLMHQRRFVLVPLCEIAPDFMHPIFGKSNIVLLNECGDKSTVVLCSKANKDAI